jgi:hypothetical protein
LGVEVAELVERALVDELAAAEDPDAIADGFRLAADVR